MPLPGGPSDKLGNEYERWWTASVMLDLLREDEGVICVEAIGEDWDGVEFWVQRGGTCEGHQVKRQWGFSGAWTLGELKKRHVLSALKRHLDKPSREAHFVSRMGVQHLDELVERARASDDLTSFTTRMGAASAVRSLAAFKKHWGSASDAAAFADLRRIHVDAIAPAPLGGLVRAQSALWFDQHHSLVVGALGLVVLDNLGIELGPAQIWEGLNAKGITRRPLGDVAAMAHCIQDACSRYLNAGADISGHRVARSVVMHVENDLAATRLVWVVGDAGTGKSEVLRDIVRQSEASSKLVLPFRLDRLAPAPSAPELGAQLGLPGGPVHVLAAAAQGNDALLVIDQLDAVSVVSGRRAELLDAVLEVVRAARHHPNIRVLVACRQFDLDNDHRLRELQVAYKDARTQRVGGLQPSEISDVLSAIGVDAGELDDAQRRLLALPLHLAIYGGLVGTGGPFTTFGDAMDLFHEYVRRKRRAVEARTGDRNWNDVVDTLLDAMSRDEQLSTSWGTVYRWEPFAEAMASEHVIVQDEDRVAFFHEALFDYLFGQHFDATVGLADWLLGDEQGLFRRAQIRQLLTYRRGAQRAAYLRDLREILLGHGIRFHLQRTVVAWLAHLQDPDEDEAAIVLDFVTRSDRAKAQHGLQATRGSRAWYSRLRSHLPTLLDSPDPGLRRQSLWWLIPIVEKVPDDVADLLEPRTADPQWLQHLAWFVGWCRSFAHGPRFVGFVVALIESGAMDIQLGPLNLWADLYDKDTRPSYEGVLRVSAALLRRNLVTCNADAHLDLHDHWAPDVLAAVADGAPVEFLDGLTSVFVEACEREQWDAAPWNGDGLSWTSSGRRDEDVWTALATQLGVALAKAMSMGDPAGKSGVDTLSATNSISPQRVVAQAYRMAGSEYADEAVKWLVSDERRLNLQDPGPLVVGNITEDLIRDVWPHCSGASRRALEDRILAHYAEWERTADGRKARGRAQWSLLNACGEETLTKAALRRLQELQRKFGEASPQPVRPSRVYTVCSPIQEDAASRMDDEAWLGAMRRYQDHQITWGDDDAPRGGVHELSAQLRSHASQDPERFVALARRIPQEVHESYLGAILTGVMNAKLPASVLAPVILQAHDLPDRPLGWAILDCIQKHPEAEWPADVLSCVEWYAVHAPLPPALPDSERTYSYDRRGDAERVHSIAINSIRGRAAEALGLLVHANETCLARLTSAIEAVASQAHPAVRCCAAVAVQGVLRHDPDLALTLTKRLLVVVDVAAATSPMERLLWLMLPTHFEDLVDELSALVDCEDDEIAAVGARRVVLAALSEESAVPLAERCLAGTAVQSRAAATILAANLVAAPHRGFCASELARLFHHPDAEVRREAGKWTHKVRKSERADIADFTQLAQAFVGSPAYLDEMDGLLLACEQSNRDCAALIVAAGERFLEHVGRDAGDLQKRAAFTAHQLTTLILKAYAQTSRGSDVRRRCLDVIDSMYLSSVRDMEKAVAAADR